MSRLLNLLVVTICTALAACGGGDSGTSAPTMQLKSAKTAAEPYSIPSKQLTATYNGVTYTAVYSEMPDNGTSMFNGQQAYSSTITLTVSGNGQTLATETSTAYYLKNPYSPLGLIENVNGTTCQFRINSYNPLPATLTVGDSGTLDSGDYYVEGNANAVGTLTETWTVTAHEASTLYLNVMGSGMLNGAAVSDTVTYSVDAQGNIAIVSVSVTLPGGTVLTFS